MPYTEHSDNNHKREGHKQTAKTKEKERKTVPWWDSELSEMKVKRVTALRKWEDSGCPDDWEIYKKIRNKTTNMVKQKSLRKVNADTSGSKVHNKNYGWDEG